jgi:hypothetical protein
MKDKVIGKSVRIQKGEKADVAMEYTRHQSGVETLASVRYLPNVDVPRDLASLKAMDIIAFNSEAEQAFVELLAAMCDAAGPAGVPVRSARAECAFRLGISTETAKRYIEKWTAPSAPFAIIDGVIRRKEQ